MPILFGQIVHRYIEQAINDYLQTGKASTLEELMQGARGQLNAAFIDSTRHVEFWRQKPNKYYMMQEIYYYGTLSSELVQDYKERLQLVFDHFLMSETFQQITAQKGALRIGEPEQFRSMKIDGIQVFVVMDFHYYNERADKWIIVDWKTGGESDDDRQQLALYAYYVQQKYRVSLEQIEVYNEYLLTGKRKKYRFTAYDMDNILHTFQRSVLAMKKYQADIFLTSLWTWKISNKHKKNGIVEVVILESCVGQGEKVKEASAKIATRFFLCHLGMTIQYFFKRPL